MGVESKRLVLEALHEAIAVKDYLEVVGSEDLYLKNKIKKIIIKLKQNEY
jgi:hypothetical protein